MAFDQATKKPFSRTLIAAALHQNINAIAVLIDGTPQILALPLDGHKDFVDMPGIPQPSLSFFKFTRLGRPKLLTPLADRFIRNGDTTFGQQLFDLTEAQREAVVQPDGMADYLRGKTVTLVAGNLVFHAAQSAKPELN